MLHHPQLPPFFVLPPFLFPRGSVQRVRRFSCRVRKTRPRQYLRSDVPHFVGSHSRWQVETGPVLYAPTAAQELFILLRTEPLGKYKERSLHYSIRARGTWHRLTGRYTQRCTVRQVPRPMRSPCRGFSLHRTQQVVFSGGSGRMGGHCFA